MLFSALLRNFLKQSMVVHVCNLSTQQDEKRVRQAMGSELACVMCSRSAKATQQVPVSKTSKAFSEECHCKKLIFLAFLMRKRNVCF